MKAAIGVWIKSILSLLPISHLPSVSRQLSQVRVGNNFMGGISVSQLLNFAFNVRRIFQTGELDLDNGLSCLTCGQTEKGNIKVFPS